MKSNHQIKIELRPIPADGFTGVVRLHRAVFDSEVVACTIYGCQGADHFLANLVAFPQLQPNYCFWGAWHGGELVAYAQYRALSNSWHLNNIAVLPAYRAQGIGGQLWRKFIDTARQQAFDQLTLDVESDNQPAVDWYRRKGLEIDSATWRYEKKLQSNITQETESTLRLESWAQAQAAQSVYGFSNFQILNSKQVLNVGRLGDRYFKVNQPLTTEAETALEQIDPNRSLLVFSDSPLPGPEYRLLGKSLRMRGSLL